jgi:hypothetical protein
MWLDKMGIAEQFTRQTGREPFSRHSNMQVRLDVHLSYKAIGHRKSQPRLNVML